MTTRTRILGLTAAAGLTLASLTGCQGQGSYTRDHLNAAQLRMDVMKSATSWDMARQAFLAGNLEKARRNVDISIGLNPEVAKSHVLSGRIELEEGQLGDAVAAFERALEIESDNVEGHFYLGVVFERLGRLDQALEHYLVAADSDRFNSQFAIAAAETMVDLDRPREAETYLASRMDALEHDAGIRQTLGHLALLRDDVESSVRLFTEASMLAPNDPAIAEDLARVQLRRGDFIAAESTLRHLVSRSEGAHRIDLATLHAKALVRLGRPIEARSILQDVTRTPEGRTNIEAWTGLGHIAYRVEDRRTLREAARRAIELGPDQADGHVLMAMHSRLEGQHAQTLAHLDRAASFGGDRSFLLTLRGLTLAEMGENDRARETFAIAAMLAPESPRLRQLSGERSFATAPID